MGNKKKDHDALELIQAHRKALAKKGINVSEINRLYDPIQKEIVSLQERNKILDGEIEKLREKLGISKKD